MNKPAEQRILHWESQIVINRPDKLSHQEEVTQDIKLKTQTLTSEVRRYILGQIVCWIISSILEKYWLNSFFWEKDFMKYQEKNLDDERVDWIPLSDPTAIMLSCFLVLKNILNSFDVTISEVIWSNKAQSSLVKTTKDRRWKICYSYKPLECRKIISEKWDDFSNKVIAILEQLWITFDIFINDEKTALEKMKSLFEEYIKSFYKLLSDVFLTFYDIDVSELEYSDIVNILCDKINFPDEDEVISSDFSKKILQFFLLQTLWAELMEEVFNWNRRKVENISETVIRLWNSNKTIRKVKKELDSLGITNIFLIEIEVIFLLKEIVEKYSIQSLEKAYLSRLVWFEISNTVYRKFSESPLRTMLKEKTREKKSFILSLFFNYSNAFYVNKEFDYQLAELLLWVDESRNNQITKLFAQNYTSVDYKFIIKKWLEWLISGFYWKDFIVWISVINLLREDENCDELIACLNNEIFTYIIKNRITDKDDIIKILKNWIPTIEQEDNDNKTQEKENLDSCDTFYDWYKLSDIFDSDLIEMIEWFNFDDIILRKIKRIWEMLDSPQKVDFILWLSNDTSEKILNKIINILFYINNMNIWFFSVLTVLENIDKIDMDYLKELSQIIKKYSINWELSKYLLEYLETWDKKNLDNYIKNEVNRKTTLKKHPIDVYIEKVLFEWSKKDIEELWKVIEKMMNNIFQNLDPNVTTSTRNRGFWKWSWGLTRVMKWKIIWKLKKQETENFWEYLQRIRIINLWKLINLSISDLNWRSKITHLIWQEECYKDKCLIDFLIWFSDIISNINGWKKADYSQLIEYYLKVIWDEIEVLKKSLWI